MIVVRSPEVLKWYESLRNGAAQLLTCICPRQAKTRSTRILRGSDPALANTYVLVTAHYDHLGMRPEGSGDRIYNGAR